jgi:uncharacterized Fe-S center protein
MTERAFVFFHSARASGELIPQVPADQWYAHSLVYKLEVACRRAMEGMVRPGDVVAIKVHLGERYTARHLRPTLVRQVVDLVTDWGGKPIVTDTLLRGSYRATETWTRRGMHEALATAARNGFTPETLGAPLIFADYVNERRGIPVDIGGRLVERAYVAPLFGDVDALISLAHFKGHDCASIGGQMKNLGVGCQAKQGKHWIHHEQPFRVDPDRCDGCGDCVSVCPEGAVRMEGQWAAIDEEACVLCAECLRVCAPGAIGAAFSPLGKGLCARIGEAATGVVQLVGQAKCGFVNVAVDITPLCDCDPFTDVPFVQDLGIFASRDPVALDRACVDAVTAASGLPNSMAEEAGVMEPGVEKFNALARVRWLATPGGEDQAPDWRVMLDAAEGVGLGTQQYHLTEL